MRSSPFDVPRGLVRHHARCRRLRRRIPRQRSNETNEQTGKARAWKECETRMGRKKKKKIGSRTSLPVGCRTRTTVHGAQVVAHASRLVHSWLHPVRRLPRRWPGPRARTLSRRLKFMNVANSRTGPRVPCRIYRRRAEYRRFIGYYIYMYIYTFTYKSVWYRKRDTVILNIFFHIYIYYFCTVDNGLYHRHISHFSYEKLDKRDWREIGVDLNWSNNQKRRWHVLTVARYTRACRIGAWSVCCVRGGGKKKRKKKKAAGGTRLGKSITERRSRLGFPIRSVTIATPIIVLSRWIKPRSSLSRRVHRKYRWNLNRAPNNPWGVCGEDVIRIWPCAHTVHSTRSSVKPIVIDNNDPLKHRNVAVSPQPHPIPLVPRSPYRERAAIDRDEYL